MLNQKKSNGNLSDQDYGKLADMVEYQIGAVVSRTLLKADGGNFTLFAFDREEGLSEHTTPSDALLWVLEGELEAVIGGETYSLLPGDFIRLPANIPHAIRALESTKMGLILFH